MTSADDYQSLLQFLYRAPIGLIQTDASGMIEMINPLSASLLMPLAHDGVLNNLFTALQDVAPHLRQLAAGAAVRSGLICEGLRIPLPAGIGRERGPKDLSFSLLRLADTRLIGILADDTMQVQREQQALYRKVSAATRLDTLTGMPNRLAVVEQLQLVMRRAANDPNDAFAVFYIRCDRLTQVNDAFGHAVGDELQSVLADRLRALLRMPDGSDAPPNDGRMAAHINEGEFVVLLEGAGLGDEVHPIATRLVDDLSQPYLIGPAELHCAASIGVVLGETNAAGDADAVLQNASIAMVEAERAGGGRYVVFDQAMHTRATQRGNLEADLRRALGDNQIFVVYQPEVGLHGPRCVDGAVDRSAGVEALARWHHPTRGILPPDAFIAMAEECGVIGELGEFVLSTACHQFVTWQTQLGALAPRSIAVNLSRQQLALSGLAAMVASIIHSSGIPPNRLQLEVTESLAAQNQAVQSRLRELKALGLTLALDDFGTGYSSLSTLQKLPMDTVKIDRSFVTDAPTNPHLRALIDATVRVAHSLNLTTVAEGIETEAQAKVIRELGCDRGQGYLFSKPLVSADLVAWLTRA